MLEKGWPNRQPVLKFGFSRDYIEDRWAYTVAFTGIGSAVVFLCPSANMPGPAVPPERYAAFLLLAGGILVARLAGFNVSYLLFIPVAPAYRGILSPTPAGADGQATFCFPPVRQGVIPARLVMHVIAVW